MFAIARKRIPQDLIRQVREKALAWLTHHLRHFHPQAVLGTAKFDAPSKPFVELVVLCIEWKRLQDGCNEHDLGLHKHLDEVVAFSSELIKTYDVAGICWNSPESLSAFAQFPRFASLAGLAANGLTSELHSFVTEGCGLAIEGLPSEYLDIRYTLDHAGVPHSLPDRAQLYAHTVAAQHPIVPYLYQEDIYAITHTIFYMTDMGHQPIEETIAACDATNLRWLVQTLMGVMLWKGDLDLVAECLMCAHFLNISWNYTIESSWESISKRQRGSGVIPGPIFNEQEAKDLDDDLKLSEYEFVHGYHTTLVTILAALHCLREDVVMQKKKGVGDVDD